jgi:hypothetical protein
MLKDLNTKMGEKAEEKKWMTMFLAASALRASDF